MSTLELLLALLRYGLSGEKPSGDALSAITEDEAERIYALAKKHDVVAMAAHAMLSLGIKVSAEIAMKLHKQIMQRNHIQ